MDTESKVFGEPVIIAGGRGEDYGAIKFYERVEDIPGQVGNIDLSKIDVDFLKGLVAKLNPTEQKLAQDAAISFSERHPLELPSWVQGGGGTGFAGFIHNITAPIQDVINKVIPEPIRNNPITQAVVHPINQVGVSVGKLFDDPTKLNAGDLTTIAVPGLGGLIVSDIKHPRDALVQASIVGTVAAGPAVLGGITTIGSAIPASLASVAAAAASLLNKGKNTISNIIEDVKSVLGGAKIPSLGGLSNFKLPDFGSLNLSNLGDIGKLSIPSGLKDALSSVTIPHAPPAQYALEPDSMPVNIPSSGLSPIVIAVGAGAAGLLLFAVTRK